MNLQSKDAGLNILAIYAIIIAIFFIIGEFKYKTSYPGYAFQNVNNSQDDNLMMHTFTLYVTILAVAIYYTFL